MALESSKQSFVHLYGLFIAELVVQGEEVSQDETDPKNVSDIFFRGEDCSFIPVPLSSLLHQIEMSDEIYYDEEMSRFRISPKGCFSLAVLIDIEIRPYIGEYESGDVLIILVPFV